MLRVSSVDLYNLKKFRNYVCRQSSAAFIVGWGKFYPKGKASRPENPKLPKDDKVGDSADLTGLGGTLSTLLFTIALFGAFALMNLGRSDAQVSFSTLPPFSSAHL